MTKRFSNGTQENGECLIRGIVGPVELVAAKYPDDTKLVDNGDGTCIVAMYGKEPDEGGYVTLRDDLGEFQVACLMPSVGRPNRMRFPPKKVRDDGAILQRCSDPNEALTYRDAHGELPEGWTADTETPDQPYLLSEQEQNAAADKRIEE